MEIEELYEPRFMSKEQLVEICNLRHTARIALSGTDKDNLHGQMIWAAKEFHKKYVDISETAAYKDLSAVMYQSRGL